MQPVMSLNADGQREAELVRWGLIPFWAKGVKIGDSTFNARCRYMLALLKERNAVIKRVASSALWIGYLPVQNTPQGQVHS